MPSKLVALQADLLPEELAKATVEIQDKVLFHKARFDVAISGGSLAKTMAAGMAKNPDIRWDKWNIWLADERIVPLDSEDSNFGIFKKDVLDLLPGDTPPRVYPLDVSRPLDTTSSADLAKEYQSRMIGVMGLKPKLDLVFLGMGPDGHTCSLFPGHKLLEEHHLFVSSLDDSPKPPPRRITLTKPALAAAEHLFFVATGASKQQALAAIFAGQDKTLPSYQVVEEAKNTVVWFCDLAAVEQLPSSVL